MSEQQLQPALQAPEGGTIVGRNPVLEALKHKKQIDTLYLQAPTEGKAHIAPKGSLLAIIALAKQQGVLIKQVAVQKLDALSDGIPHQGVVAICAAIAYTSLETLLAVAEKKDTPPFFLICDEIEDPHNLGAMLRTAEATGADGVIIPKRRSVGVTQAVYKTSAGAASMVPVCRVTNLRQAVHTLKQHNIWIYCADLAGTLWCEQDYAGGVALIVGAEGRGVSHILKQESDFCVNLPMCGQIQSLNASVAAGVFMYEIARQRRVLLHK